jgi:hypothetical protein
VNHKVGYFHVGGFTHPCPWGCDAKYLKTEWEKLAKPNPDGSVHPGRQSKCCKNGKTHTEYMRQVVDTLNHPPPIIKVR